MRAVERLEEFRRVVDGLVEENLSVVVIVEGERDVAALRELGLSGEIVTVHRGRSLVQVADDIAADHDEVIVLTDWDRTGGTLARRISTYLEGLSVSCDLEVRRRLARIAGGEIRTVEGLPALRRNLERRAGR